MDQKLLAALEGCRTQSKKYVSFTKASETTTQDTLITPVLEAMGWDVKRPNETRREVSSVDGSSRVDYLCFIHPNPVLLVEAKNTSVKLTDPNVRHQAFTYSNEHGPGWVVTTNGIEWRLYNAHAAVPGPEKLFLKADLYGDLETLAEMLTLLSQSAFRDPEDRPGQLWKEFEARRRARRTLLDALADGSKGFGEWLAAEACLDPADVPLYLRELGVTATYKNMHPAAAWDTDEEPRRSGPKSGKAVLPAPRPATQAVASAPQPLPRLKKLFDAGILQPGAVLSAKYRKHSISATLLDARGSVRLGSGRECESLAQAMDVARKAIHHTPSSENAWRFWKAPRPSDGKYVSLLELEKVIPASAGQGATVNPRGT